MASTRIRRFALAFLLALFVVVLWGAVQDGAHAEDVVDVAPPAAATSLAPSIDDTEEAAAATPVETPGASVPEPAVATVEDDEPTAAVVEDAVETVPPVEETSAPSPEAVETDTAVAPAVPEPAQGVVVHVVEATVVEESPVTVQAHATPAVHQCNADTYPTGAGWEASCVVTIENTLGADGSTHSRVTMTWCLAEAGVLPPEGCTTDVSTSNSLVTSVDQCNGILAGGSNVTCSVEVVNNVPFARPTTEVTVNQCIGSGQGGVSPGGPPTDCDPVDSSTSGATVTQCNGSANGGGAPERVQCAVVGGATALPVTVNQCNGSTAAGSTVTCDVRYTNNFAAAAVEAPTPVPAPAVPASFTPVVTDLDQTARPASPASARSSARPVPTPSATPATSLAATGAATSTGRLSVVALMLLLVGGLLLGGARRRPCRG